MRAPSLGLTPQGSGVFGAPSSPSFVFPQRPGTSQGHRCHRGGAPPAWPGTCLGPGLAFSLLGLFFFLSFFFILLLLLLLMKYRWFIATLSSLEFPPHCGHPWQSPYGTIAWQCHGAFPMEFFFFWPLIVLLSPSPPQCDWQSKFKFNDLTYIHHTMIVTINFVNIHHLI